MAPVILGMLAISRSSAVFNALVDTYCANVASRVRKPKWSLPIRWRGVVPQIESALAQRGIGTVVLVETFVDAQFDGLDRAFCQRTFHLPYPPIHVLLKKGAFRRYNEYRVRNILPEPKRTPLRERLKKDIALIEARPGSVGFLITSGSISLDTLSYYKATQQVSSKEYDDTLEWVSTFIPEIREQAKRSLERVTRLITEEE